MDNKGLIFTLDSALALISIFIVIVTVANISDSGLTSSSKQVRSIHNAQDILEIMATNQNDLGYSVLQKVANALSGNENSQSGIEEAREISGFYLNKTLGNSKYSLMEINQLNKTIASNGDIKNANETSVGFKSCEGYFFKLYIWN
ncbi:MAG: hypothetical protein ACXVHW_03125 [Methanobacterium sp.]